MNLPSSSKTAWHSPWIYYCNCSRNYRYPCCILANLASKPAKYQPGDDTARVQPIRQFYTPADDNKKLRPALAQCAASPSLSWQPAQRAVFAPSCQRAPHLLSLTSTARQPRAHPGAGQPAGPPSKARLSLVKVHDVSNVLPWLMMLIKLMDLSNFTIDIFMWFCFRSAVARTYCPVSFPPSCSTLCTDIIFKVI